MTERVARVVKVQLCEDESCQFYAPSLSSSKHVLVTEHYVPLQRENAIAVSYTWGEFSREKSSIGHYNDGKEVLIELGDEWELREFVQSLHDLCNIPADSSQEVVEFCWIDQLCIRQENTEELRQTLARIPDIYHSLDVVVLLPGARCECGPRRLKSFQRRKALRRKRGTEQIGWCLNNVSLLSWTSRIWTRQEFLYAEHVRFKWIGQGLCRCPDRTGDSRKRDLNLTSDERHAQLAGAGLFNDRSMTEDEREHLSSYTRRLLQEAAKDMKERLTDRDQASLAATSSVIPPEQTDLMVDALVAQERLFELVTNRIGYQGLAEKVSPAARSLEDIFRLCAGKEAIASSSNKKELFTVDDPRYARFAVSVADMYTSARSLTKLRDYVAALWVDCPDYRLPAGFQDMSLGALLQDVVDQLRHACSFSFITYTPAGLFGQDNASRLHWQPAAFIDSNPTPANVGEVYATLLPNMRLERGGPFVRLPSERPSGSLIDVELACAADKNVCPLRLVVEAAQSWHEEFNTLMYAVNRDGGTRQGESNLESELTREIFLRRFPQAEAVVGRLKNDPTTDAYAIARRIVGGVIGLPPKVVENKRLRLMIRTASEDCPVLVGLTWKTIGSQDCPDTYSMRIHIHYHDFAECTGDEECEDEDLPPVLYEVEDAQGDNGGIERNVFGVWTPTTALSFLPVGKGGSQRPQSQ